MTTATLTKVTAKTAKEVCQRFTLEDEAKPLLKDSHTPRQFLDLLLEKQQYPDAAKFLAFALPKREAIWWACQCVRQMGGPPLVPAAAAALQAAEKWATDPNDDNRRACLPLAEAADLGTPAGATAVAVYFSGGSISLPDLPEVPPPEHVTPTAISGAVVLCAVIHEPQKAEEKYRKFFATGIDVANGKNRWKETTRK